MAVGTFIQPNFEVPAAIPGSPGASKSTAYKTAIDNAIAAHHRLAGPFAPHEYYEGSPAVLTMKVAVDAGFLFDGMTLTEVAAQQTGAISAPVTNPRIDRIVGDLATGAITVVAGSEDPSPVAPALPAGKFPICQVTLTVGQTTITNQALADERVPPAGRVVVPLGDWNLDTTQFLDVTHGVDATKIVAVHAVVRNDADTIHYPVPSFDSAANPVLFFDTNMSATAFRLRRTNSSVFDSTNFDSTSFNRGWIVIQLKA